MLDDNEKKASSPETHWDNVTPYSSYNVIFATRLMGMNGEWRTAGAVSTPKLQWGEGEAVATSTTSARLRCETNLANGSVGGFEWMRENAPTAMKPAKAPCPVVNGQLTGSLRNLKDDVYYKCRPYWTDIKGKEYLGDWFIVFTGDAGVYFAPEVQTFAPSIDKTDGAVTLSGYALAGSDDIIMQGFEYSPFSVIRASDEWKSVTASGIMMNATLTDLLGNTEYVCRAFVETAKGRFYGAEDTFTTPTSADIDDLPVITTEVPTIVGYYNLQGYRLNEPENGINIVIYSDGTSRKILIKNSSKL